MATYKIPCVHCGAFTERGAHYCPKCGSRTPFGYHCPACLKPIERGNAVCAGCGRPLAAVCPYCRGQIFVGAESCGVCGKTLMIQCENERCQELQFFENDKCTACGKIFANKARQIDMIRNGGK